MTGRGSLFEMSRTAQICAA